MDSYVLQSYFKSLCTSYKIVIDEVDRIIAGPWPQGLPTSKLKAITFWNHLASQKLNEVTNLIEILKREKSKIIITSYYEVVILIHFFKNHKISEYDIINMNEEFLDAFPKDEISLQFLQAYIEEDNSIIVSLADNI